MIKVLFICHGNICRSPMAEFIFKDMIQKRGIAQNFYVASCATSTDELGDSVYPPAKAVLARHGISCKGKYAVQLTPQDYDKYDMLIAMDSYNVRNIYRMVGGDPAKKISKLMDYTPRGGDVDDPWYSGDFEIAYNDIYEGCKSLLDKITSTRT